MGTGDSRYRVLVNPSSSGGKAARHLPFLEQRTRGLGGQLVITSSAEDLTVQAARAVQDGVERLIVAGGDGTFHLAVQALAHTECSLGLLPFGRGNDFATTLGVPKELGKAWELAVEGNARLIDLGRVNGEYFSGYCGVGFDSAAVKVANSTPRWMGGTVPYIWSVLRTLVDFKPPDCIVAGDGIEFSGSVMFVVACNVPTFGGGMRIAPEAAVDDGRLDLVIVEKISRLELLRVFPKVYKGSHVQHPEVRIQKVEGAQLTISRPIELGSDGEIVDDAVQKAEISVVPQAMRVVAMGG